METPNKQARNLKKFGAGTTHKEVIKNISMEGKNILITGGNSGIGEVTALAFAVMGANVYILCRDVKKEKK